MKSKTFKKEDGEKVIIKSRDIKSRKDPFIEDMPGITTQQFRNGIEVRASSSGGGTKILYFPRLGSVGTGNQSFSGFGFSPNSYSVKSWNTGGGNTDWSESNVLTDGSIIGTRHTPTNVFTRTNILDIRFSDSSSNRTVATHVSFDTDGMTMNFTSSGRDVQMVIIAYS